MGSSAGQNAREQLQQSHGFEREERVLERAEVRPCILLWLGPAWFMLFAWYMLTLRPQIRPPPPQKRLPRRPLTRNRDRLRRRHRHRVSRRKRHIRLQRL